MCLAATFVLAKTANCLLGKGEEQTSHLSDADKHSVAPGHFSVRQSATQSTTLADAG